MDRVIPPAAEGQKAKGKRQQKTPADTLQSSITSRPSSTTPAVIETHRLRKAYGGTVAVDSLTLSVARGEVFGFLGPNGAGKTTTIKMLLGLVFPSSGEAHLLGKRPGDPAAIQALVRTVGEEFERYAKVKKNIPEEALSAVSETTEPAKLADLG